MATEPLTVGFDLDMTLIDSRPGIKAVYDRLAARDRRVHRLGAGRHPARSAAGGGAGALVPGRGASSGGPTQYRALYVRYGIEPTGAMAGAREALEAVRSVGGRTLVVTAKHEPNARLHLDHLDIRPDLLAGDLWAEAKAVALREHGAAVYVGRPRRRRARAPGPRARCRSRWPPGRATRTNCGRPARTWCWPT